MLLKVADAEVEYKNISIEGPTGAIRTSTLGLPDHGTPEVSRRGLLIRFYYGAYLHALTT